MLRGPATRVEHDRRGRRGGRAGELRLDVETPAAELRERLLALPGIGPWTADYLAMRVLGNPDILLTSDLVVRQAAAAPRPRRRRARARRARRGVGAVAQLRDGAPVAGKTARDLNVAA